MRFLIDTVNKVAYGWSAKCGCSHIKKIFYFLTTNDADHSIHNGHEYENMVKNITDEYKVILFIRNPYERIVSGFLNKYKDGGEYRKKWDKNNNAKLNFTNFVIAVASGHASIDPHHFTPQLSEHWNNYIASHPNLKVFDIQNINYQYIESLYNKIIPLDLINFRGKHENKKISKDMGPVYDSLQSEYEDVSAKPLTKNFYNDKIVALVNNYYKRDFIAFAKWGFNYVSPIQMDSPRLLPIDNVKSKNKYNQALKGKNNRNFFVIRSPKSIAIKRC